LELVWLTLSALVSLSISQTRDIWRGEEAKAAVALSKGENRVKKKDEGGYKGDAGIPKGSICIFRNKQSS